MIESLLKGILTSSIVSGTSLLYATLGEVLTQRAGIVNLGLEGALLIGASVGFAATLETGNPLLGILAAALAAALFNLAFGYLVITRRANQPASGLTMMFLGTGLSALIGKGYVGRPIVGLGKLPIPGLAQLPWVGPVFFNHDLLVYLVVPAAVLIWWLLFRTRWGLGVRAVGESPTTAFAAGRQPGWLQYQALFIAGLLAGVGGAHLSVAYTLNWSEGMTAGRGFIAIALVIFSKWHPLWAIAGALLFGGLVAFQLQLQASGMDVSPFLLNMVPYVLTILVLMIWGGRRRHAAPAGLGQVYRGTE
ncbi:MAG: ABC transporter permease [Chloroflexi bacterium]|nr:ABC transporter permease [Chloroflexota bacterium]